MDAENKVREHMKQISDYVSITQAPRTHDSLQRAVETWNAIETSFRAALAARPADGVAVPAVPLTTKDAEALAVAVDQFVRAATPATTVQPKRCPLCNYQHGHAIGCERNPVDIALAAAVPTVAAGQGEPRDAWFGGSSYEASCLRELLANIFRDGGHYVAQHGLEKALLDAHAIISERNAALSSPATVQQEQPTIAGMPIVLDETVPADTIIFDPKPSHIYQAMLDKAHPKPVLTDEQWDEIEGVIACLGDDAAQLRDSNPEDERADNMDRAAELLSQAFGIGTSAKKEQA